MQKLTITQWAEEDRPREKFLQKGSEALSDAELLAILIGSGSSTESAVDLMKHILTDCHNNLNTLGKLSVHDLMHYHGIGEAKAITIIAACELGKRRALSQVLERQDLGSAQAIYEHMHPHMQDLDVEEAWIVLMNQNYKHLKTTRISHGGISETAVDVRIIMKEALLANATILALCHNHPSGSIRPSREDDRLTQRIKQACDIMRIHFADHVIVTDGHFYSYREQARL